MGVVVDKGGGFERWIPINVFFSFLASLLFISFGTKSIFDRDIPSVHTIGWVYLVGTMCVLDGAMLVIMTALLSRSCRKEVRRRQKWYVYPDSWYNTHMLLAATTFAMSAWATCGVVLFYLAYGGEDPYTWPSVYNVERWEKPIVWGLIMAVSTGLRLHLTVDKYIMAYWALAEPGLIEDTAKTTATTTTVK